MNLGLSLSLATSFLCTHSSFVKVFIRQEINIRSRVQDESLFLMIFQEVTDSKIVLKMSLLGLIPVRDVACREKKKKQSNFDFMGT